MLFCEKRFIHDVYRNRLVDESLRWLIANGKVEESKAIIRKACRANKKNFNEVLVSTGFRGRSSSWHFYCRPIKYDKNIAQLKTADNVMEQRG